MPEIKDRYQLEPYESIPDVWILDEDFQKMDIIDDYTSLIWSRRYYEVGDFELYVRVTDKNLRLLNVDLSTTARFIMRNDTKEVMRIEKIEISTDAEEGDFITASGRDLRCLLYQRVTNEEISLGETLNSPVTGDTVNSDAVKITEAIYTMVNYNLYNPSDSKRKIPRFSIRTNTIDVGTSAMRINVGENVGEKVEELCNDFRIGWKAEWNGSQIVFTCYEGEDRTSEVVFSEEFSNLIKFTNTENLEDFYNTMLLHNEYTDEEGNESEDTIVFGNDEGFTRFEKAFSGSEDLDVPTTLSMHELAYTYKFPLSYKITYQNYTDDGNSGGSDPTYYYAAQNYGSDYENPYDTYIDEDGEERGRKGSDYMSENGKLVITRADFYENNDNDNYEIDLMLLDYDFYVYNDEWLAELESWFEGKGELRTEHGLRVYHVENIPVGSGHIRTNYHLIQRPSQKPVGKWERYWNIYIPAEYTEDGQAVTRFYALPYVGQTEEEADERGYPVDEYPDRVLGRTTVNGITNNNFSTHTLPFSFDIEMSTILVRERYIAKCYSMMEEALSTNDFEGEIAPDVNYRYREDYDIGDKIRIKTDIGIQKDVRILEAVETFDSDGYNIEVKFGV